MAPRLLVRSVVAVAVASGAAGCAWSESKYISERAEADCEWALRCETPAVLAFRGWETQEACLAAHGPEVAGSGLGCEYNKKASKSCVKGIEASACPAEGAEQELPVLCGEVYRSCGDDTEPADTSDTGT